jgi:apolipoprotein N-acyltransferase
LSRAGAAAAGATLALLGALQTLAFVHTAWWPLPLLATAVLAAAASRATPRRAALLGWAFGCGWLVAGTWWLFVSLHRYGGLPAPLAAAAVALLSAALSLYLALAMGLYARWRSGRAGPDAALFAGLWLLAELARGVLFTGFPWLASGYAQIDGPLAVLLPWVGVYAVGALGAAGAALVAAGRRPAALAAAAVAALALLPVPEFTRPTGRLSLALLQPNVAQDEKFALDRMPETLAWVAQALTAARADLIIAPETAVPLLPDQLQSFAPGYWEALTAHFATDGRAALVGVPLGDYERGYTNSVIGLSAAAPYRYDKYHLVPFGEFIPTGFRWFTELMNIPLGDFARGVPAAVSFAVGRERVAPNICYEDLFGEELARRFVDAAGAPTVLANLSNIGWFGDTIAVPQHLAISRARSLELQRPMVRATNTGATAVVDHRGVVAALLPPHQRGVLVTEVQGREGRTPFAVWAGHAGLWPLLAVALLALLPARRRQR